MQTLEDNDEIDIYDTEIEDTEYDIIIDEPVKQIINMEDITEFKKTYKRTLKKNITSANLTKYEKTRILSERTQQIENGSTIYISNYERFTNSYSIALEEFNQKKIPFIIRRPLPDLQTYEYWKLSDMI